VTPSRSSPPTRSAQDASPALRPLSTFASSAGCACKIPQFDLSAILSKLPAASDPNLLVGHAESDDAAVYRIPGGHAVVQTIDFFTPVVDDPRLFGRIAATNALSDVYAMRGRPVLALAVAAFPMKVLPAEMLQEILRGGAEKVVEAGAVVGGGHSIDHDIPLYGLSVTGVVEESRITRNKGARPGDALVLTKPLGIGVIATAAKNDQDRLKAMPEAIRLMATLNRDACDAMLEVGAHAATDVTGFGLLGHLRNVCAASGVSARIAFKDVPVLEAARTYVREGIAPGGTHANWRFLNDWVTYGPSVGKEEQLLLCDAQTSGGLLIALSAADAPRLVAALERRGTPCAAIVGDIVEGPPRIEVG